MSYKMTSYSLLLAATIVVSTLFLGSSQYSRIIVVDQSGKGNFKKVQDAINFVPSGNNNWIHIVVKPGIYYEKVNISDTKNFIFLEGGGYSQTLISWGDYQTTSFSATFSSFANNFVAKDISFRNSYNTHHPNDIKQAIAASINGDKSAFYNCGFYGIQDTLYAGRGRHYYKSCYIEGAVDIIWGYGQAFFESCNINIRAVELFGGIGYITAQGRPSKQDTSGFVFSNGNVVGDGKVYLGRAYGTFSRVVFSKVTLSSIVQPLGWSAWTFEGKEGSFTNVEAGCRGPGADTSHRAPWTKIENLDSAYLNQFSVQNFVDQDGWLSNTPFGR